jgi:glycosyltransferase involved in cell wall biosynthesis
MSMLATSVLVLLGLLTLEQIGAVVVFALVCRSRLKNSGAAYLPKALVVLPLRGADPSLADCLRGIATQDYPDYELRIVVDSHRDPAYAIAQRVLAELKADHVDLQLLREPRSTCSLKCSAVHQATENLPGDVEVVATIDADIAPQPDWLRELVAPLANPKVGAAMGNRWYAPTDHCLGSIVCYLWNAPVVVSMFLTGVPWGGSLAVRSSILRDTDLRDRWLKAGCEDIPLFNVLLKQRKRLHFVPSLLMVNRSDCNLQAALRFINRQFVWTRLYHPLAWWSGFFLYSLATLAVVVAFMLTIASAVSGDWSQAALLSAGLTGYFAGQCLLLVILETFVRSLLRPRGEAGCALRLKTFATIPLTFALTPLMFLRSFFSRRITWRGVEYEVRGAWNVRLVDYQPFTSRVSSHELAPTGGESEVEFPNFVSRLFLKKPFERQFIVPPPPPFLVEKLLQSYEKHHIKIDLDSIPLEKPIFLIGLHRSGTSMLQDLLCLHPQLGYINNSMPTFPRCFCAAEHWRKVAGMNFRGERMLGDSVPITADSPNEGVVFWREWLKEDHHDLTYRRRTLADYRPGEIDHIRNSIKKILWCYEGRATRFFCKNPSLIPHLELLAEIFPDAKFLHIVRDARTCANSMVKLYRLEQAQLDRIRATGKHGIYDDKPYVAFPRLPRLKEYVERWGADSIETTARLWNDSLAEVDRVRDRLPAFFEVRYEDILESPADYLDHILEFCELPPIAPDNTAYWERLASVGKVRHSNQYAGFSEIEAICRERLVHYGYLQPADVPSQAANSAVPTSSP